MYKKTPVLIDDFHAILRRKKHILF